MAILWSRVLLMGLTGLCFTLRAAEVDSVTNRIAVTNPVSSEIAEPSVTPEREQAEAALRAYLRLQEELHVDRQQLEISHAKSEAAMKPTLDALGARLESLERTLKTEQQREQQSFESSNRTLLIVATLFAGIGLLTMICTAFLQLRAINRFAEVAAGNANRVTPLPELLLPGGVTPSLPSGSGRLLGVIEELERRLKELEGNTQGALGIAATHVSERSGLPRNEPETGDASLLSRGQKLLAQGQSTEAISYFDQVLAADPDNAEAWWRKGLALERLRRLEDAIRCFDRALAADRSMTRAYLAKGGVFNQQERFSEALECYEQAMKNQPEPRHH